MIAVTFIIVFICKYSTVVKLIIILAFSLSIKKFQNKFY